MGLLVEGTPLSWDEIKPLAEHIRYHGITQFINIWDRTKGRICTEFLWGDEIEYMVACLDDEHKTARLSLRQSSVTLDRLRDESLSRTYIADAMHSTKIPIFHEEYGRHMIESTPGAPFSDALSSLLSVGSDMRFRRQIIYSRLEPSELLVTVTSWPRMGVTDTPFTQAPDDMDFDGSSGKDTKNVDMLLTNTQHPRFRSLHDSIHQRRGRPIDIRVPLFIDKQTLTEGPRVSALLPCCLDCKTVSAHIVTCVASDVPTIQMDAVSYGLGCCGLQVTSQASNIDQARYVHDAMVVIAPIMLTLTAASPIFHGRLADIDTRWSVVAASVDDRTEEEENGVDPVTKQRASPSVRPRWSSVSLHVSNDERNKAVYNDVDVPIDDDAKKRLIEHCVDAKLADHVAHLFSRDPLVQMSETIDQDDNKSTIHFEGINTVVWPSVRFKPPPLDLPIGWRVELRTMEIQMTDFENAAFVIFVVLLTRAITHLDLNFYIPISRVHENMERAHQRNAAAIGKFVFRKNISPSNGPFHVEIDDEIQDMSMDEIMNGDGATFPGLTGFVEDTSRLWRRTKTQRLVSARTSIS
ncbi:hypothetical protein L202_07617 [Cryptococcus amylolentus CBS 6039]|uniref:Glutamate--cysteine ligase n=1 Tax=Cryptococcus amylolentus CBS 6039 TaxID=1295533 RepID=A0A1E3HDG2_9TREE|nr:hypothetical protein L202_07617 [Cryptococcus amylolentus CBS 6039]ODN74165.1 hypothetical protein L202_07617 [Cryptococcus amylolentus CBS 6039]